MDTYNVKKHDIGITNPVSGDLIGFMLAQDKTVPQYQVFDDEYLAQQIYTGEPGYGALPPEKELALRQDDWRSGFGQEFYDADDPKRYYGSYGCDLRFKGMAIAGYKSTAFTIPLTTSPAETDGGLEIWTDPNTLTNWTKSGTGTLAQDNAQQHGGTWCARFTNGGGETLQIYQDIAWSALYQGRRFTFTAWAKTGSISSARVSINDGVTTVNGSYHTGGGAYEQLTVSMTLSTAATRLRIYCDCPAQLSDVYFDDADIAGTTPGAPGKGVDFNDEHYVPFGTVLAKENATGTTFTAIYEFATSITALEPFTDNNLYIAIGTTAEFWYMSTAEALTESNLSIPVKYFRAVHTATPVLWGSTSDYEIRSATDPTNAGAFAAATTVGSSYYAITGLQTRSGALYIMKEDMPYYLDSTGAVQNDLAPELESGLATTSGANAHIWKNKLYIPFGAQGLLETDGTTNTFKNPSLYCTNLGDFVGRVMAVASDEEWLFVAVDNSTKIEILAGREETIGSTTEWVWHPIHELTLAGCNALWVSTFFQKRLYIASTSSSDSFYYLPLPTGYGNITSDTNKSFLTDTYFTTPYLHGNFKDTIKAFLAVTATMSHSYDNDVYWECYYEKLGDTTWTKIGNFKGTLTNRVETIYIPDALGTDPVSTYIRLKWVAKTDSTSLTPILNGYNVQAILYPPVRELIFCTVRVGEKVSNKMGQTESKYDTQVECLDTARDAQWPVTIKDINGVEKTVKPLPLPRNIPRWEIVRDEKGREIEKHYNLLMQAVTVST